VIGVIGVMIVMIGEIFYDNHVFLPNDNLDHHYI
jgi:hypothetical protein